MCPQTGVDEEDHRGGPSVLGQEHTGKLTIEEAKQRFNVTEGMHIWQNMFGCDWDDETNEITGYDQYAFDGEDFIIFDFETATFKAPVQQAVITKQRWEKVGKGAHQKNYIINECTEHLKRFVHLGASVLKRTELPLVSLLQKSSSALVTCHATGFYPDRALMFWTKDGDELHEGVDPGEILPNGDGTYQKSVDLDLSWVPPEDWDKYDCVFNLSGVEEDIITKLDQDKIRTNEKKTTFTSPVSTARPAARPVVPIVPTALPVLSARPAALPVFLPVFLAVTITVLAVVLAAVTCVLYKKHKVQREQDVLQEQNLRC